MKKFFKEWWSVIAGILFVFVILGGVVVFQYGIGAIFWSSKRGLLKRILSDSPAKIICYSGPTVVYKGKSTGMVWSEETSDGYFFMDAKTGRPRQVSGHCDIDYL